MAVVPGFASDSEESEGDSFERLTETDALRIAAGTFGVEAAAAEHLDTERDDTFRVSGARVGDYVLKVAHPADRYEVLDLQTQALRHAAAADRSLPLQGLRRSIDGDLQPLVGGRVARMFGWLPGTLLADVTPEEAQLELLGESLAKLGRALRDFEHPAARRPLAWDVLQLPALRPLLERFPHPALSEVFDRFERLVLPREAELPKQVVHNDFHQGNVLVDPANAAFVTGILDFGDTVYSARIADVAVAASYLTWPAQADLAPFLVGYQRITALDRLELELLPELVMARFAERILVNQWLERGNPDARVAPAAEDNLRVLTHLIERAS